MQNRYVGDIGDFAKYGLLRALVGDAGEWKPRLAVIWYLVPDEDHNSDGRHTRYLSEAPKVREAWRICDPPLYDALKSLVEGQRRSLAQVEEADLLPSASFFSQPLAFERGEDRTARGERRRAWIQDAAAASRMSDLVFLDPDNGLEVKVGPLTVKGPKYAYFDDLKEMAGDGRSLIVYQHATRQASVHEQFERRLQQLEETFPDREPFGLYFSRVSARVFLCVPSPAHSEALLRRCQAFVAGPWGSHFHLVRRQSWR